jgi:hypothetical protein
MCAPEQGVLYIDENDTNRVLEFSYTYPRLSQSNTGIARALFSGSLIAGVFVLIGGEVNAAFDYDSGDGQTRAETRGLEL